MESKLPTTNSGFGIASTLTNPFYSDSYVDCSIPRCGKVDLASVFNSLSSNKVTPDNAIMNLLFTVLF